MPSEHAPPPHRHHFYPRKKPPTPSILTNDNKPKVNPSPSVAPKELSPEELRIRKIAEQSYDKGLKEYQYPSLPDPQLIFDYTKEKGFFINDHTWQITLNLANTPDIHLNQELADYFFMLSVHEIGHYVYCPYDGNTDLKL
jgi:hypothetical protein